MKQVTYIRRDRGPFSETPASSYWTNQRLQSTLRPIASASPLFWFISPLLIFPPTGSKRPYESISEAAFLSPSLTASTPSLTTTVFSSSTAVRLWNLTRLKRSLRRGEACSGRCASRAGSSTSWQKRRRQRYLFWRSRKNCCHRCVGDSQRQRHLLA